MSKSSKVRLALIGCGFVNDFHLKGYARIPEVELVAAVDVRPERLREMKQKWGIKAGYKDWKKMLKEVRPDAVSVATPNALHAAPTIDALNAGAHVMVEKPMAMTVEECEQMVAAAKKNKRLLAVGFQVRYNPATQFLVRARDEGQFGKVLFVRCQALRRRGIPNWGVFGRKELQGGGPMIDIGVHVLEAAHYTMGRPRPVAASGNIWTYFGNRPSNVVSMWPGWDHSTYTVEDLAIGQVRFDTGAILHIEAAFVAHIEKEIFSFQLMGEQGGGRFDPPAIFTDRAGTMVNVQPGFLPEDTATFEHLHYLKMRKWVESIVTGSPLEAPGEDGLAVQKMLAGIYRSAEVGREVEIR